MEANIRDSLIDEGIRNLYRALGPVKTMRFFKLIGINRGDTLKEIEEKTAKMSKEEALSLVKKSKR